MLDTAHLYSNTCHKPGQWRNCNTLLAHGEVLPLPATGCHRRSNSACAHCMSYILLDGSQGLLCALYKLKVGNCCSQLALRSRSLLLIKCLIAVKSAT